MNNAETNAQISKILSDLKNCQENLLNETLIISEEPRILDERVLPTNPHVSPRSESANLIGHMNLKYNGLIYNYSYYTRAHLSV